MGLVHQRHEFAALCVHAKAHQKEIKSIALRGYGGIKEMPPLGSSEGNKYDGR